ncbi:MAG: hypothetical protein ACXVHM_01215 [Methanobacterium sp.]
MEKYKVTCIGDNKNFVVTNAFLKLKESFIKLKSQKGIIIHVIGAPGTGKSSNIYHAQKVLDLNVYSARMALIDKHISPKKVFKMFINTMKQDLGAETVEQLYKEISKYDAILFADHLLDSESLDGKVTGLGGWMHKNRLSSIYFYLLLVYEYLTHRKEFKKINVVFHTTWTYIINGNKYDFLTDFSVLSLFFKSVLKLFFEVIEISYTEAETIEIVKSHFKDINEEHIKYYIDKYGYKPRLVLNALENDLKTLESYNTPLNSTYTITKSR